MKQLLIDIIRELRIRYYWWRFERARCPDLDRWQSLYFGEIRMRSRAQVERMERRRGLA